MVRFYCGEGRQAAAGALKAFSSQLLMSRASRIDPSQPHTRLPLPHPPHADYCGASSGRAGLHCAVWDGSVEGMDTVNSRRFPSHAFRCLTTPPCPAPLHPQTRSSHTTRPPCASSTTAGTSTRVTSRRITCRRVLLLARAGGAQGGVAAQTRLERGTGSEALAATVGWGA